MLLLVIAVIIILITISVIFIVKLNHSNSSNQSKVSNDSNNSVSSLHNALSKVHAITENKPKKNRIHYPILYINLDRSPERNEFMLDQFKKYGIKNYMRINGVDGSKIDYNSGTIVENDNGEPLVILQFSEDFDYINKTNPNDNISKSELGCTLSHIKAIKYAYDNKLGTVLILEDDVDLSLMPLWEYSLPELVQNAPKDWDYIKLYHNTGSLNKNNNFSKDTEYTWSTSAYLISPIGQLKINNYIKNNQFFVTNGADVQIYEGSNTYSISTPCIIPNNLKNDSTIHTDHTMDHINRATQVIELYIKNISINLYEEQLNIIRNSSIPKLLHLIWIGSKNIPTEINSWTIDFQNSNPDWKVIIWRDKDIDKLNLKNRKQYNEIIEICGKADIARYEILYRYGGMYIDADTIWLKNPLNPLLFKDTINLSWENDNIIMNGWFSCIKNHPFLKIMIDEIPNRDLSLKAFMCVGPYLVTDVYNSLKNFSNNGINFVPITMVLCPNSWHGIGKDKYIECKLHSKALAFHWGESTNQ
jgi:GR25 family glycosyltransferase involved in LPS biosynthesis